MKQEKNQDSGVMRRVFKEERVAVFMASKRSGGQSNAYRVLGDVEASVSVDSGLEPIALG